MIWHYIQLDEVSPRRKVHKFGLDIESLTQR